MTTIEHGQWMDRVTANQERIRHVSASLDTLSDAFRRTGNEAMFEKLYDMSRELASIRAETDKILAETIPVGGDLILEVQRHLMKQGNISTLTGNLLRQWCDEAKESEQS